MLEIETLVGLPPSAEVTFILTVTAPVPPCCSSALNAEEPAALALNASVFFGGDPGSPDTFQKFYADVEMYANTFDGTDPENYLGMYRCGNEPKPESQLSLIHI